MIDFPLFDPRIDRFIIDSIVKPRLSEPKGTVVIFTSTPRDSGWMFDRFVRSTDGADPA